MGLVTSGYYIVCSQQTGYVGSKKGFVLAISFCLFFFSKVSATEEFLTDSSYMTFFKSLVFCQKDLALELFALSIKL
jgi:hypothetical protein